MERTAVDGMGGDFSPQEIIKGFTKLLDELTGFLIILSGKTSRSEIKVAHNFAEGSLIKKLARELSDERHSG